MNESLIKEIIREFFVSEVEEAQEVGALGYYARIFAQVTMPHSKPTSNEYERHNGQLVLSMLAPSRIGLPYGSIPRLLLAWVTTEAVRTKSPKLILGTSASSFLSRLGFEWGGGPRGNATRVRNQMRRLFSATVSCSIEADGYTADAGFRVASSSELWWDPKQPDQQDFWESNVTLSDEFFRSITARPVPVDMVALKTLGRSPLSLDLYTWLTYRYSYLRKDTTIPWEALHAQFGADYGRVRDFKAKTLRALGSVGKVYPAARFDVVREGLVIHPSRTHIPKSE